MDKYTKSLQRHYDAVAAATAKFDTEKAAIVQNEQGQVVLSKDSLDKYIDTGEVLLDAQGNQIDETGKIIKPASEVKEYFLCVIFVFCSEDYWIYTFCQVSRIGCFNNCPFISTTTIINSPIPHIWYFFSYYIWK